MKTVKPLNSHAQLVTSSESLTGAQSTPLAKRFDKIWLTTLLIAPFLFSSFGLAADQCELAFAPTHHYERQERSLDDYNRYLTGTRAEKPVNLITLIPVGGVAIDSGDGSALAFHQLAAQKGLHAVVVSPHDYRKSQDLDPQDLFYGSSLDYRIGKSEDILNEYKGQASLITDVRGRFSNIPDKVGLIESYYDALATNGTALIVYTSRTSPVRVRTSNGNTQDLARWLEERYPSIFSVDTSADPSHRNTLIIRMKRDPKITSLEIPLRIVHVDERSFSRRSLGEPTVLYAE